MNLTQRLLIIGASAALALGLSWGQTPPAAADPATSISYPAASSNTRYMGRAFDTCTAPSLDDIRAWEDSPYRALGVYIGGDGRTCAQPNLTSSWVGSVSRLGWKLIPIYLGPQPVSANRPRGSTIKLSTAAAQGKAAADDAIAQAKALGMIAGSAIYYDVEAYDRSNTNDVKAVLAFESAWTRELHAKGYLSGLYLNLTRGAADTAGVYTSTSYARADAIWIARWDGSTSLKGWAGISDSKWAVHQRGKQYRGDHTETYGGVTMNIDSDQFDAPVATVLYSYKVTAPVSLNARTGPSTSYETVKKLPAGASLKVVCQTNGATVKTTKVWDRLSDGTYVSDLYVSTPSGTGMSRPLPRCRHSYQVDVSSKVNVRTGPGTSYATAGSIPNGGLAAVVCQKKGSKVGTTTVWNKLDDATWVSDYYVTNRSNTTWSAPLQRC
ncbi:glycoside hydrolase domain-containing protein [Tessaracoccus palaemonis]|uniref:DUF1906 domain-containing protein n=1 Tax=Tessaracoccus palaemonis TaxID=2829499 RepID=A0ABX8SFJ8_9ACTN|nr:glycoside hydrolase domain-containing protein [Tessaracoccus palaemonis]QXT61734.1 DUF1906 domain-containing protein [Tessaracoccus palaemonis]